MQQHRSLAVRMAAYGAVIAAALLVVFAEGVVSRQGAAPPAPSGAAPTAGANPLPADIRTLLAGQQLARFYCASCHSAWAAAAPPAGATADQLLYQAVADGVPGAVGHSFSDRLTETQIWQLVGYLRAAETQPGAAAALPAAPPPAPAGTPQPLAIPDHPEPLPALVFVHRGVLWASPGDQSPIRRLTPPELPSFADQPVYAPASGRVAFVLAAPPGGDAGAPAGAALYTVALDGRDLQLVRQATEGDFHLPSWTPDGAAILVTFRGPSRPGEPPGAWRPQIVRIDLADGTQQTLIPDAHSPALSRDGARLAFLRVASDGRETSLVVAGPDGGGAQELLSGRDFAGFFAPRFSPDGRRVVVAAIGGPPTDPSGLPVAERRGLLAALLGWLEPRAAEAHVTPPWNLWVVDVDGGGVRRLAALNEDLPMAAFSPDGTELIVMSTRGLYRMRADGTGIRRVALLGDHGAVDWVR